MKIKVKRQMTPFTEPYFETFDYDGTKDISVAGLLDFLNYNDDIFTDDGKKTTRIGWECSCLQGVCGSCAMVINGVPALACETFLKDLDGDAVVIEPLKKFPVTHDLIVERAQIQENLKRTDMFIGEYHPSEQSQKSREKELQYLAAKCLKCGLCMEVCPNYVAGKKFFGAAFANDCFLVSRRNREKAKDIKKEYGKHFGKSCSKSLSCMDVCPMNIPIVTVMAKLNR